MPASPRRYQRRRSKSKKLYCGSSPLLPNSDYSRRGTPNECLQIGIGVGRRLEFEDLKKRVYSKYSLRLRRRPRKKG